MSYTPLKTINGQSIKGTGDLTVTGSGAAWGSITGTLSSQTDLQSELDGKLDLDGGNANTDIDIDTYSFNAKSLHCKGTGGAGHLGLKHQSGSITASTSESTLGADSSGNPVWKNDGNPIQNVMLENAAITGATKTKITYDSKGLVTSGADATTADIADSTNKRYVTDAQLTVIGNTSGTNTGDQTSIVGISGTKSQFDTACSDGNFLYVGDVTQYTDEMAQDAVGGMATNGTFVDLTYVDATPTLTADLSATGTPDNTTFLRGDNTWAVPTDPAGWTTIVKSANQDVTNSTTFVDDTDLQFSVVAGGHYMIEMDIAWSANNATGDYKFEYALSTGTMTAYGFYYTNNVTTINNVNAVNVLTSADITLQTISANIGVVIPLKIVITALINNNATFSYRFANAAAAAGRTSRTWKGSILKYKRID